jgi:hypothetical protein
MAPKTRRLDSNSVAAALNVTVNTRPPEYSTSWRLVQGDTGHLVRDRAQHGSLSDKGRPLDLLDPHRHTGVARDLVRPVQPGIEGETRLLG